MGNADVEKNCVVINEKLYAVCKIAKEIKSTLQKHKINCKPSIKKLDTFIEKTIKGVN